jgi:tetratricopeptide (TPR) repeat protein
MTRHRYISLLLLTLGFLSAADLERGRELYTQGKYSEAATELQAFLKDNADDAQAHRLLGLALIEQGKASDAATHINRAVEIDASGDNKLALARLHAAQKNWDKAEEALGGASGDELEYVRGIVHLNRQRSNEAAKDLEAFLERHPDHAYAHYYAGLAHSNARRPDRMLRHFEAFVKLKPDAPEARKVRAVLQTGR